MEINTLVNNIQTLGFKTFVINNHNWKYSDFSHLFEPNKIFIFSTDDVGYGEYGLMYPEEIKKDKWQNAYGIIQCADYEGSSEIGVMFSVIPKACFDNVRIISACLKAEQECSFCNKISKHVKIDTDFEFIFCMDCYSQITS